MRRRGNLPSQQSEIQAIEQSHLYKAIRAYFHEKGWITTHIPEQTALHINCTGENGQWTCYAQALSDPDRFLFYSILPVNVPVERRLAVMEFLTRANFGVVLGNFEFDLDDGEVRFKTSGLYDSYKDEKAFFDPLVYANMLTMDGFLPQILNVIYASDGAAQNLPMTT